MKILVRLPNWLGDMVMAVGFLNALRAQYPDAEISVIAKKGIHTVLPFFPPFKGVFLFSKSEWKGLQGAWRFGRTIRRKEKFDLFFCLPDSLSAAVMARATGAKKRIGFCGEGRSFLLTHTFRKPANLHRAEEYATLLQLYTGTPKGNLNVSLPAVARKEDYVVVNINFEASSRRLTTAKAVEVIDALRRGIDNKIILAGSPKEKPFIDEVYGLLANPDGIENGAGNSLPELAQLLASAQLVLSTDSGPAHLANALGTHTVVLFGAGNEANTAPYQKELRTVIRLGQLSCEPCLKNVCKRYQTPQCLERLNAAQIVQQMENQLKQNI